MTIIQTEINTYCYHLTRLQCKTLARSVHQTRRLLTKPASECNNRNS